MYGLHSFRIVADETPRIRPGRLLQSTSDRPWRKLHDGGVIHDSSARNRGLQVADIVVHTLYRANKASWWPPGVPPVEPTGTDLLARRYLERLVEGKVLFNLTQARERVRQITNSRIEG